MPSLVAHRGHPFHFPENTLASLRAARESGAGFVEFDVQLSRDGRPFLMHDEQLERCTSGAGPAAELSWDELSRLSAGEPGRFGDRFAGEKIPALKQAADFLAESPSMRAFVELKPHILRRHPAEAFIETVLGELSPVLERCKLISFSAEIVEAARGRAPLGWILDGWNREARREAERLAPDTLFLSRRKLPRGEALWPGPWAWAVYSIDDARSALESAERGFEFIETNRIGELRGDPRLEGWT